jgi:hypothetical protein
MHWDFQGLLRLVRTTCGIARMEGVRRVVQVASDHLLSIDQLQLRICVIFVFRCSLHMVDRNLLRIHFASASCLLCWQLMPSHKAARVQIAALRCN